MKRSENSIIYDNNNLLLIENSAINPNKLYEFNWDINIIFALPELVLLFGILFLLVFGSILAKNKYTFFNQIIDKDNLIFKSIGYGMVSLFLFMIFFIIKFCSHIGVWTMFGNALIISDGHNNIKILILLISAFLILISMRYLIINQINSFEYFILIGFITLGGMLLISSFSFINFYLALELQSISIYLLCGFHRYSAWSIEAALKYFILGGVSSAILLFGISLIYGFSGGFINFMDLHLFFKYPTEVLSFDILQHIGLLFILIGILFKLAIVPFHFWAPEVYEGSFLPVTALIATLPKFTIIISFLYIFDFVFGGSGINHKLIEIILMVVGSLSIFWGSISAIKQKTIKRFLAYTSINQMGFFIFGFIAGGSIGIQSCINFIVIYVFQLLGIFGIMMVLVENNQYITDLSVIRKSNKSLALMLSLFFFSLLGIPPFAGFFSKYYILQALVEQSIRKYNDLFIYLPFIFLLIIFSVIAAYYYFRIVKIIWFDDNSTKKITDFEGISKSSLIVVSLIFMFNLTFMLFEEYFVSFLSKYIYTCLYIV
uniref:NADH dehydrogenase subunit 2 n=1 Tax=Colponema vietnamica TaxID=1492817 RepID=V5KV62_9ALVE|nr:NADH dehydrogenase subunit 2 [Colponema vietnamica]ATY40845.1 NADH dehydrogenase subunit 2 [Colponema vietnamica]